MALNFHAPARGLSVVQEAALGIQTDIPATRIGGVSGT